MKSREMTMYVALTETAKAQIYKSKRTEKEYENFVLSGREISKNIQPGTTAPLIEFKIPKGGMGESAKNALEIINLVATNINDLQTGKKYAKVNCYMGAIRNNGVIKLFSPYINDIEIVETPEAHQPYVDSALNNGSMPKF
jgi:hypothetical protein